MSSVHSPLDIGGVTLKNRIGFGPVNLGASAFGNDALIALGNLYSQFASSGIGITYIGGIAVSDRGRSSRQSLVASTDAASTLVQSINSICVPLGTRVIV